MFRSFTSKDNPNEKGEQVFVDKKKTVSYSVLFRTEIAKRLLRRPVNFKRRINKKKLRFF